MSREEYHHLCCVFFTNSAKNLLSDIIHLFTVVGPVGRTRVKHDFLQYDCAIFALLVGAGLFTDLFVVVEHVECLHEAERGEDEEDEEDGESEVCHVHPDGGHEVGQRQQRVAQPCTDGWVQEDPIWFIKSSLQSSLVASNSQSTDFTVISFSRRLFEKRAPNFCSFAFLDYYLNGAMFITM